VLEMARAAGFAASAIVGELCAGEPQIVVR